MKERLLGAAVLIIAAVIVIPVFLDGPAEQGRVSQELVLPAPAAGDRAINDPIRTHTVKVGEQSDTRRIAAETRDPVPQATPPESVPVATPPPPVPAAVQNEAPAPAVALARAKGNWAVQVGSFSSESNARRLIEHLREADYPAFMVRNVVAGRVMFRVRVGPEVDRDRAEALAERLRSDRQKTQIVSHP
ncbi:MAG: SPOR domain-containing protein [Gammaproteobacteria bacterium]|nr:SPOR domain-containing protein [Gammaproteobacteria bacterium]